MSDERPTPASNGYLDPAIGIEAAKDAAALLRCCMTGDGEGSLAILASTEHARQLAGQTALLAAIICRQVGLSEAGLNALLAEATSRLNDHLLDQRKPDGGGE